MNLCQLNTFWTVCCAHTAKSEEKSVQLAEVHLYRISFLQNPYFMGTHYLDPTIQCTETPILYLFCQLKYRSRALKSRGSYGNSALFLQRSQYISLDFYVNTKEDSKWQVRLLTQSGS